MVLTKTELIGAFQNEVRILNHLIGKIDRTKLDYRPAPKQRSLGELVNYLSMMGPMLVRVALNGAFDRTAWEAAERTAASQTFEQSVQAITNHHTAYPSLLGDVPDAEFRNQIELFGQKGTRGTWLVNLALGHCAAYRTQLFLYLKATGREELVTSNLWFGIDPAPKP